MADDITRSVYDKVLEWALDINEDAVRREVERLRRQHPDDGDRALADRLVRRYALIAMGEGALTGAIGGPLAAMPAAVFDSAFVMRASARLNGATGELADTGYLADEDSWRAHVITMVGDKAVAQQAMRRTAVRAAQRFGARVGARSVARVVPLLGGLVGGVWNYLEVRQLGRAFVRFHFDTRDRDAVTDVTEPPSET